MTRTLTKRQLQVALMLSYGLTEEEVAQRLGLSRWTVKTHAKNLRLLTGAGNAAGVVGACYRAGILPVKEAA